MRAQNFVATEIPVGRPQVKYFELGDYWTPRGDVLRAVILTDAAVEPDLDEPFVAIDQRDCTLREFVKMVGSFGGCGTRIAFVPDDETHIAPKIKVREPKEAKQRVRRKRA